MREHASLFLSSAVFAVNNVYKSDMIVSMHGVEHVEGMRKGNTIFFKYYCTYMIYILYFTYVERSKSKYAVMTAPCCISPSVLYLFKYSTLGQI